MRTHIKTAVIQFPGSNCDLDTVYVLKNVLKIDVDLVWHKEDMNENGYVELSTEKDLQKDKYVDIEGK